MSPPCFERLKFDPPKLDYLCGVNCYTDPFDPPYDGAELVALLRRSPPDFNEAFRLDESWMMELEAEDLVRLAPDIIEFSIKALSDPKYVDGEFNSKYIDAEYCIYALACALHEHVDHENKKIASAFVSEKDSLCLYEQTAHIIKFLIENERFWDAFRELQSWKKVFPVGRQP